MTVASALPVKTKAPSVAIQTVTENIRQVATSWAEQRNEQQQRRELDPSDFAELGRLACS